jgi:hypothetical protein
MGAVGCDGFGGREEARWLRRKEAHSSDRLGVLREEWEHISLGLLFLVIFLEEQAIVRKLVFSDYLWEWVCRASFWWGLGWLVEFSAAPSTWPSRWWCAYVGQDLDQCLNFHKYPRVRQLVLFLTYLVNMRCELWVHNILDCRSVCVECYVGCWWKNARMFRD